MRINIFPPGAERTSSTLTSCSTTFLVEQILPKSPSTNGITICFQLWVPRNAAAQSIHSIDTTAGSTLTYIDPAASGIPSSAEAALMIVRPYAAVFTWPQNGSRFCIKNFPIQRGFWTFSNPVASYMSASKFLAFLIKEALLITVWKICRTLVYFHFNFFFINILKKLTIFSTNETTIPWFFCFV